jgi:citrate synthase
LIKIINMKTWLTLSRGQIGMRPDPDDPRRSLYRAADISGLTRRREVRARRSKWLSGLDAG